MHSASIIAYMSSDEQILAAAERSGEEGRDEMQSSEMGEGIDKEVHVGEEEEEGGEARRALGDAEAGESRHSAKRTFVWALFINGQRSGFKKESLTTVGCCLGAGRMRGAWEQQALFFLFPRNGWR